MTGLFYRTGLLVLIAIAAIRCANYRLPQPPTAEGSISNFVIYAYFSLTRPPYGFPPAYTEFLLDRDDEVVFVTYLEHPGPAFTVLGVLYRPDGATHREFRRDVAFSPSGSARTHRLLESFPMSELLLFPGRWTVRLFINAELAGTYSFQLEDSETFSKVRQRPGLPGGGPPPP